MHTFSERLFHLFNDPLNVPTTDQVHRKYNQLDGVTKEFLPTILPPMSKRIMALHRNQNTVFLFNDQISLSKSLSPSLLFRVQISVHVYACTYEQSYKVTHENTYNVKGKFIDCNSNLKQARIFTD